MKGSPRVASFSFLALLVLPGLGQAQGYLENPQPNSFQSGISVVSGWHCNAGVIEMQADGGRLVPVAYGTERKDTESVCGDWDNGFVFLRNYSGMGAGAHTITMYADGVAFASAAFTVTTVGEEFAQGLQKSVTVADFPKPGDTTVLRWDEAKQNFAFESVQLGGSFVCDSRTYCYQMTSCEEATYFLAYCARTEMDGDGDGIPCEQLCI